MKNEIFSGLNKIHAALIVGTVVIIIAFGVGGVIASAATFKNFSPQFYIVGVDVSGKNLVEAEKILTQKVAMLSQGVTVEIPGYGSRVISVSPGTIDVQETLAHAKNVYGRNALSRQVRDTFNMSQRTDVDFVLSDTADTKISSELITGWNIPLTSATNATFVISAAGVSVVPSQNGQTIDQEDLTEVFIEALERGESHISASIIEATPEITTTIAENLRPQAAALAGEITKGRTLKIKEKNFVVKAEDLTVLLQPRMDKGSAMVGIDAEILKALLGKQLAPFEQEPKNAEFVVEGKKVKKFQPHQLGVAIDWDSLAQELFASLSTDKNVVTVVTKDAEPEIKLETTNDLGIKEIIGTGLSDFAGSPKNRIHNISVGMKSLENLLIAPGETFSLMTALGAIDGSTGYLQELVIKDNKTQLEYGGGLCQIGTTTFRAAMGAGFPIVERRNHSYQVGYYFENGVSGTDATIYDPKPDFRFKNDTAHWVLLDPHMNGKVLEFNFWGTSDGRKASRTIPKKLAAQPAPPKKEIFTTTLAPGKVKCTEKAHAGATMMFSYSVEYPDGTVKKEDFTSYYKPWAEVCLVGVAATSTPSAEPVSALNIPATISPDASGATGI